MTDELRAKFDLLPCPFCGGRAEVVEQRDEDGRFAAVGCSKCGAGSRQHYFCGGDAREHVVSAWNKRAAGAEVEALKRNAERLNAIAKWCAAGRRVEFAKSLLGNGIEIGLHNPIFATVKENLTVAIDAAMAKESGE